MSWSEPQDRMSVMSLSRKGGRESDSKSAGARRTRECQTHDTGEAGCRGRVRHRG